jgi:hypothetical protein
LLKIHGFYENEEELAVPVAGVPASILVDEFWRSGILRPKLQAGAMLQRAAYGKLLISCDSSWARRRQPYKFFRNFEHLHTTGNIM